MRRQKCKRNVWNLATFQVVQRIEKIENTEGRGRWEVWKGFPLLSVLTHVGGGGDTVALSCQKHPFLLRIYRREDFLKAYPKWSLITKKTGSVETLGLLLIMTDKFAFEFLLLCSNPLTWMSKTVFLFQFEANPGRNVNARHLMNLWFHQKATCINQWWSGVFVGGGADEVCGDHRTIPKAVLEVFRPTIFLFGK